jgi:acetolactate synthase-1/2/3 large subunit
MIVDSLVANGIDRLFCVPGESYLGLLDALYGRTDIDTVACRHEAGAGFMAIADARLTGRPGVVCVSRGPGASNAAIAVHTAQQDEVPLILFIGQVPTRNTRRDSFQEIDYRAMYGSIAKWVAEVTDPARMAETLLRAIRTATAATPGPVVIAVPEDVLTATVTADAVPPQAAIHAAPRADDVTALRRLIAEAARPLVLAGRSLDRPAGREALRGFLEQWDVPTVVSFRAQDLFPNAHRLFAGDMGLANPADQMAVLRRADLLIVLGARLTDITTQGYTWPDLVRPQMLVVHIHPDPSAAHTLLRTLPSPAIRSSSSRRWAGRRQRARIAESGSTRSQRCGGRLRRRAASPSTMACPSRTWWRWSGDICQLMPSSPSMPGPSARRSIASSRSPHRSVCSRRSLARWALASRPRLRPPCANRAGR